LQCSLRKNLHCKIFLAVPRHELTKKETMTKTKKKTKANTKTKTKTKTKTFREHPQRLIPETYDL